MTTPGRVELEVDGRRVEAASDRPLLDVLREAGARVPSLCHDPRLEPQGSCGLCAVEVARPSGWERATACLARPSPGLVVRTESEALEATRRATVELLFGRHTRAARYHPERARDGKKPPLVCACRGHASCTLRGLCLELGVDPDALGVRPESEAPELLRPGIELEMDKCVRCERCVRICREVAGVEALGFLHRGEAVQLAYERPLDVEAQRRCDACEASGALCIDTCPTDALHAARRPSKGEGLVRIGRGG